LRDEPLSNLDAKLRVQMRAEIGKLQRDLKVTTIYVTHDQTEAMTLGHRVAVMRKGVLQQIAAPQHLYDHPDNLFVAGFIGSPAMNFMTGTLEGDDAGSCSVRLGGQTLRVPDSALSARPALKARIGGEIVVGIRPEDIEDAALARSESGGATLTGRAELVEPLGSDLVVHISTDVPPARAEGLEELASEVDAPAPQDDRATVVARFDPRSTVRLGDQVTMALATDRLHFFDPASGTAVWAD